MIIKKLRPLNYAGEHNLPPPAKSYNVNPLINNKLARHAVAGEFHEAQAWRYAGKGAGAGLAMSQLILTRCARRRVCGSGQAWHPRLRAGGAARDGAAGPCGGTSGAEGLEWQRLAAVRDSTECCALLLRTCNPSKRHRERACGLRKGDFEPGRALEWGTGAVFGLGNAEIEPESEFRRTCGLRMQSFEPRKAVRDGLRGAVGLRYRNTDPARPSRRANGIEIDIPVPESVDAETITGEQKPKPPAGLEFPRQNHYLCRAKYQDRKYGLRKTVLGRRT